MRERAWVRSLQAFYRTPWYLAIVVALMACANVFALELPVYYCYFLLCFGILLFSEDMLPVAPLVCGCYMSVSAYNNPAAHQAESQFYQPVFLAQIFVLGALAVAGLLARLIFALAHDGTRRRRAPRLWTGFLLLGAALIAGGAFSGFYNLKTAGFGFIVTASLCAFYFLFYYTVDWTRADSEYLLKVMLALGFGLLVEIVGMYCLPGVFDGEGNVDRSKLVTGWGMYNNVGCMIAICIPAAFYFAVTRREGWIFSSVACLFLFGTLLTQSRNSVLFGGALFLVCAVFLLFRTRDGERIKHLAVAAVVLTGVLIAFLVFREQVGSLFGSALRLDGNGRGNLYATGWEQFLSHPFFGVGFYQCPFSGVWETRPDATYFIPDRYHNTFIQLLASGGIVAFAGYLVHRVQTVMLFFRRPALKKTFLGLSAAIVLLTSLLDCHLFNIGPALLYSMLLVCAECSDTFELQRKRTETEEK